MKYGQETGFTNDLTHEIIFSKKLITERYYDRKMNKFFKVSPAIKQYAFSHEYGHFVDNLLSGTIKGHLSNSKNILMGKKFRAATQKYVAMFEELKKTRYAEWENPEYTKLEHAIRKDLNPFYKNKDIDFREFSALQDTINALSKGRFTISFAHPDSYWQIKGNTETEIFANLFSLRTAQYEQLKKIQIDLLNKYFPGLWDSFLECIKEIELYFSNRYDPNKIGEVITALKLRNRRNRS